MAGWIDRDSYWLSTAPQSSDTWKELRKNRLTASKFHVATGFSQFETREELALQLKEEEINKKVSEESELRMQHGVRYESEARQWYERTRNVKVLEVGLAVPKWDNRIGASLDGEILNSRGMIEIKCPMKMYEKINTYLNLNKEIKGTVSSGGMVPNHIWDSHYDQMQGCMAITNKEWCDYIVYCVAENRVFVHRIYFNQEYWKNYLYPNICHFFKVYLS